MHLGKIGGEIEIMENDINNNIKILYEVFKSYTILGNLRERSCDCCITNSDIKFLMSKKLKDLSEQDLWYFMTSAITTFGNKNDYKHFLPRILELLYSNESLIDDFLTFEKLNYSNWKSWEEEEFKSIQNYFLALWVDALNNNSDGKYFESVFTLVLKYIPAEKVFSEWEKNFSIKRIKTILKYILYNHKFNISREKDELFNKWLSSKEVLELLEKKYNKIEDVFLANEISITYTILEKNGNY